MKMEKTTTDNIVLNPNASTIWAEVSADGVLIRFDNEMCRRLADEYDPYGPIDQSKAIAFFSVALLERAAAAMDHILREGGGTQGDTIRALNIPSAHDKRHTDRRRASGLGAVLGVNL